MSIKKHTVAILEKVESQLQTPDDTVNAHYIAIRLGIADDTVRNDLKRLKELDYLAARDEKAPPSTSGGYHGGKVCLYSLTSADKRDALRQLIKGIKDGTVTSL